MKVYSPSEMAKLLEIKPATLRKYSILLEQRSYSIKRNSQNHRYYNDDDIITLRRVIAGSKIGITLSESIDNVLSVREDNTYTNDTNNDVIPYSSDISKLDGISNDVTELKQMVQALTDMVDKQQKYINQNIETINHIESPKEDEPKKKGLLARIFNK